jgi:hypothetical protein
MMLAQITEQISWNAHEWSLGAGLLITLLFWRKYRKYELEIKRAEMLDQFLC